VVRPFHIRLTRCAATTSFLGSLVSSHHWAVIDTDPPAPGRTAARVRVEAATEKSPARIDATCDTAPFEKAGIGADAMLAASRGSGSGSRRSALRRIQKRQRHPLDADPGAVLVSDDVMPSRRADISRSTTTGTDLPCRRSVRRRRLGDVRALGDLLDGRGVVTTLANSDLAISTSLLTALGAVIARAGCARFLLRCGPRCERNPRSSPLAVRTKVTPTVRRGVNRQHL